MMANSLQSLFEAIQNARDEQELRQHIRIKVREHFAAQRCALFLADQFLSNDPNVSSLFKLAVSIEYNPVLRYLLERHAPVHEELLLPPGVWKTICPLFDHGHVMAGPIVCNSRLIGGVGLTRDRETPGFNHWDIADLSALCLHLSSRFTTIRSIELSRSKSTPSNLPLTPREIQIAELVAQGLTNAQIGANLWITENSVKQALKRIFRKLEVSSRAEMVAQFYSSQKTI
jgi:DNA-binding CsgD family transcriptional regulator